jgi:hypothetical protein
MQRWGEVFNVLVHHHVDLVADDETEVETITPATKVREWFVGSDSFLRPWVSRAYVLNQLFGLDLPLKAWKPVLTPSRDRDVSDICAFAAERVRVPVITNLRILGRECRPAGAFTALRSMVADSGVDVSDVRPSAPLCQYERTALPKICSSLILLAPSLMRRTYGAYRRDLPFILAGVLLLSATISLLFATIVSGVKASGNWWMFGLPMSAAAFGAFLFVWRWSEVRAMNPYRVEFAGLSTFADLSRVLAEPDSPAT